MLAYPSTHVFATQLTKRKFDTPHILGLFMFAMLTALQNPNITFIMSTPFRIYSHLPQKIKQGIKIPSKFPTSN